MELHNLEGFIRYHEVLNAIERDDAPGDDPISVQPDSAETRSFLNSFAGPSDDTESNRRDNF